MAGPLHCSELLRMKSFSVTYVGLAALMSSGAMPPSVGTLILTLFISTELLCNCAVVDTYDAGNVYPPPWEPRQQDQSTANNSTHRASGDTDQIVRYNPDDLQIGCTELRSKRYISDGFCTSSKPITEVVCTGECLPLRVLPWYAEYIKVWARIKTQEWRCVNDVERHKRVHLRCEDGDTRTYRIKTVTSCKCKKYSRAHNGSKLDVGRKRRRRRPKSTKKKNTSDD